MVIHISIYYIVLHYSINSYVPSTALPASAAAETSFSRLSTGARQLMPQPAVISRGTGISLPGRFLAAHMASIAIAAVVVWNVIMSQSFFSLIVQAPSPRV